MQEKGNAKRGISVSFSVARSKEMVKVMEVESSLDDEQQMRGLVADCPP